MMSFSEKEPADKLNMEQIVDFVVQKLTKWDWVCHSTEDYINNEAFCVRYTVSNNCAYCYFGSKTFGAQ